jgi:hypothetical protein
MGHELPRPFMNIRSDPDAPEGKRYTCLLPLDLAARLEALFEMHPQTPRSKVIADLLHLGVAEVERTHAGEELAYPFAPRDNWQPIYLLSGPFAEFHKLSYKHHLALERAQNKEDSSEPNTNAGYQLGDTTGLE